MTCRELADFLGDYVAGELDARERAVFDAHLAACAECVAYLRGYRDIIRFVKDACREAGDVLPADVPASLVRAILAARGRSVTSRARSGRRA
jgi:anti-sigma factor RsiW